MTSNGQVHSPSGPLHIWECVYKWSEPFKPAVLVSVCAAYVLRMCCVCAAYVLRMCCVWAAYVTPSNCNIIRPARDGGRTCETGARLE